MSHTWENGWKPNFGHDFGPHWSPKKIFVIFTSSRCIAASLYVISRKTNEPNLRKWQKNEFCVRFWLLCPNSGRQFFFFLKKKMRLRHSLDIVVIYRHVQYQKKLMIQSWENLVGDGQTGRRKYGASKRQVVDFKKISRCYKMSTNQFPRYKLK